MRTLLMLTAVAAFGTAPTRAIDCHNAVTQHDLNACAALDYDQADAALNRTYEALIKATRDSHKRDRLRDAQRAWIRYRDAQCAYANADNESGSIYPMVFKGCLTRRTRERTKTLQTFLKCQRNPASCGM